MRKRRVLLAGLLAGSVSFVWGAVSHMALGIEKAAVKALPNEAAVLDDLSRNVTAPGLYVYPSAGQAEGDRARFEEAYRTRPHGILVYVPPSGPLRFGRLLAYQFATELLCGWIAAVLLATAAPSLGGFAARVLFVVLLGAFATLSVDVPYWNWYGFPTEHLAAQLVDSIVGWGLAGLVLARLLRPPDA